MSTLTIVLTGIAAGATIYGSYMWLTRKKPKPKVNTRLPATFPIKRVEPAIPETLTERMVIAAMGKQEAKDVFGSTAVMQRPVTRIPAPPKPPESRKVYARQVELPEPDEVWSVARQRHEPVFVPPVYHATPDYYTAPAPSYSSSCSSRSSSSSYDSGSSSSSYSSSCDSSSSSSDSGSCGGGCD